MTLKVASLAPPLRHAEPGHTGRGNRVSPEPLARKDAYGTPRERLHGWRGFLRAARRREASLGEIKVREGQPMSHFEG